MSKKFINLSLNNIDKININNTIFDEADSYSFKKQKSSIHTFDNSPDKDKKIDGFNVIYDNELKNKINKNEQILIIDTRFDYEFRGGNIENSINISNPIIIKKLFQEHYKLLKNEFFINKLKNIKIINLDNFEKLIIDFKKSIQIIDIINIQIILLCEFSFKRSPKIYNLIRNLDRKNNIYPELDFRDLYILKGGYNNFYNFNKNLCYPKNYISMMERDYKDEYNKNLTSIKDNWKEVNNTKSNIKKLDLKLFNFSFTES